MKTDSWLYSDSFLKRAFAYCGYYTVANTIVALVLYAVAFAVVMAILPTIVINDPEAEGDGMMLDEGTMIDADVDVGL